MDAPAENDWLAVNQLTVYEGQHTWRPDVVLYDNSLHPGFNGSAGGGIEGMRQRLAAVGGRLEIAAEVGPRVRACPPLERPVVAQLKVLSDLDIAERRRAQDGRIRALWKDERKGGRKDSQGLPRRAADRLPALDRPRPCARTRTSS